MQMSTIMKYFKDEFSKALMLFSSYCWDQLFTKLHILLKYDVLIKLFLTTSGFDSSDF